MTKADVTNFFKDLEVAINKHSPQILTAIGIIGMGGAGVIAVINTPKALKLLEAKKKEKHCEKLPPNEVVKTTWKCYLPAVLTSAASAGCLIKANSISTRRNAALATAYSLSKAAYSEYKDKVIETIGEKKEREIEDKIVKDKVEMNPPNDREVIIIEGGDTLCFDGFCGRYFMSDEDTIQRAIRKINRDIVSGNMYASLNEFYNEIGLSPVPIGDDLGWKIDDGEIEVDTKYTKVKGKPCLALTFSVAPKYEYYKMF